MSSQTFNSSARSHVDWDVSKINIERMVLNADFHVKVLTYKDYDDFSSLKGLTNDFYFECIQKFKKIIIRLI